MARLHKITKVIFQICNAPLNTNLTLVLVLGCTHLLPTGSEERGVLGVGSIPVAILPSCQDMKTIAL